jgi:hypothetical protein
MIAVAGERTSRIKLGTGVTFGLASGREALDRPDEDEKNGCPDPDLRGRRKQTRRRAADTRVDQRGHQRFLAT